ncbi:rhamnan synthesis F family protein [Salipiger mucosus]|uniref:Putative glycosyltransferase n=1 Tax=Salipiger mucosus DSM 16094 TaxID=1123237 RepID=S9Q8H5_9RHOB|nr:rhamnan synthesis F family protein [Salipiger mucosus]EPX75933.1 putative glycosyltransferase [Salipiger mucosus DSM 16094]
MVTTPDALWREHIAGTPLAQERPDFRFSPAAYRRRAGAALHEGQDPRTHYDESGRAAGLPPNDYRRLAAQVPDLDRCLAELVADHELGEMIARGEPEACELLCELILLGDPVDARVSGFSESYYRACHPGLPEGAVPFVHWLQHGRREGRRILRDLREGQQPGGRERRPGRALCMVALPDLSGPGLALVQEAAAGQDVLVLALADGERREAFAAEAIELIVAPEPLRDLDFLESEGLGGLDLAVLGAVESLPAARYLVREGVPHATCVGAFPETVQPAHRAHFTALFSDLTVFPSEALRAEWAPMLEDLGVDVARDTCVVAPRVLAQGGVAAEALGAARARLSRLTGADCEGRRVVLGAGPVGWAAGTDLFVLTAQAAARRGQDTLFVWLGDGANHEDAAFGVFLERQLRSAGGNVCVLPNGEHDADVLRAADAVFVPARMEPWPEVVFDAAEAGCPVVVFAGATGLDETAEGLVRIDWGDLGAACDALLALPRKAPAGEAPEAVPRPRVFRAIRERLERRLAAQERFVIGGGDYDVPVMMPPGPGAGAARAAEREKLWTLGRRAVWQSRAEAEAAIAGSENWVHGAMAVERFAWAEAMPPALSVHMHAHHLQDLGGDLLYYRALREARRIVVTTDSEAKRAAVAHIAGEAGVAVEVVVMPNVGRDVLPFLRLFERGIAGADETWCHLHQKRSEGTSPAGAIWKRFLMTILVGDDRRLSSGLERIMAPETGLVAPFDPYRPGWGTARRVLPGLAGGLPEPLPEDPLLFPVGNMFHVSGRVAERMLALAGPEPAWPTEPLPRHGTIYHAMERLWPAVTAAEGLSALFLDWPGQQRS